MQVIDKTTGEVVSETTGKPSFWKWIQYLVNDWQHDDDFDEIITFAIRMASWSDDGKEVFRSTRKLAQLAGISVRTAKRRKAKVIELGMFREIPGNVRGIPKLEIALPPHRKGVSLDTGASSDTLRGVNPDTIYIQSNQENIHTVEGVYSDTPSSATGQWNEVPDQESSAGVNPDTLDEIDPADILDEMNQSELVTHCVYCHCRTCERNGAFGWFPGSEKYVEPSEPCQCKDCKATEIQSQPDYQFGSWPADSIGAEMARTTA